MGLLSKILGLGVVGGAAFYGWRRVGPLMAASSSSSSSVVAASLAPSPRDVEFRRVQSELAVEKAKPAPDPVKVVELTKDAAKVAQAELAARKVAVASPAPPTVAKPRYPVGMKAKFADKSATVIAAHQDAQGAWHYVADIDTGLPWPMATIKGKEVSEVFLRQTLQDQLGQQLATDQDFPKGVEVYRGGQGGFVEAVTRNQTGQWVYTIRNWPNAVTQAELQAILAKAGA